MMPKTSLLDVSYLSCRATLFGSEKTHAQFGKVHWLGSQSGAGHSWLKLPPNRKAKRKNIRCLSMLLQCSWLQCSWLQCIVSCMNWRKCWNVISIFLNARFKQTCWRIFDTLYSTQYELTLCYRVFHTGHSRHKKNWPEIRLPIIYESSLSNSKRSEALKKLPAQVIPAFLKL